MESSSEAHDEVEMCAIHPEDAAVGVCGRCGDFVCAGCRGVDGACPACARRPVFKQVRWWQSSLALAFGGISAQLVGAVPIVIAVVIYVVENFPNVAPGPALDEFTQSLLTSFWVLGPSIFLTGATMAAVAFVTPLLVKVPVKEALGLRGAPWPAFVAAPIGILALGPTSDGMHRFMVEYFPNLTFGALEGLDQIAHAAPIWVVVPAMALVPGFAEEVLFRGLFQRSIKNGVLAVVLSGTVFAAYHMDPHHVAAVLPLGLYLAWLGQRTKSLFVPVTGHVFNNATAVIATVYFVDPTAEEEVLPWWSIPVGWMVCALAVAVVWWSTRATESEED